MRIYLDASPIIYWVEKVAAYYVQVDMHLRQPGVALVSSHLALLECLVHPLRSGQPGLVQRILSRCRGADCVNQMCRLFAARRENKRKRQRLHFRS
jgi:hypothetical protein